MASIRDLVIQRIEGVNRTFPGAPQSTDPEAPLFGGSWDSLAWIDFIMGLEGDIAHHTGQSPKLAGNPEVIAEGGPMRTVGSLIAFIQGGDRHGV